MAITPCWRGPPPAGDRPSRSPPRDPPLRRPAWQVDDRCRPAVWQLRRCDLDVPTVEIGREAEMIVGTIEDDRGEASMTDRVVDAGREPAAGAGTIAAHDVGDRPGLGVRTLPGQDRVVRVRRDEYVTGHAGDGSHEGSSGAVVASA